VKPGGSIVIAAECWDGVPDSGEYGKLLQMAPSPEELLALIQTFGSVRQDQWQVQIQAQVQMQADVYVKSTYLGEDKLKKALLNACTSVEDTVANLLKRYGPDARICVLPEGPMTIPHVAHGGNCA
jgi:nickel-dependent lactate racemase